MTIMKMPVHPETHWGWVLWCVDGFLAIFWLNEKFFGLRLTPAPQVHSIPFASKERARERERYTYIYIIIYMVHTDTHSMISMYVYKTVKRLCSCSQNGGYCWAAFFFFFFSPSTIGFCLRGRQLSESLCQIGCRWKSCTMDHYGATEEALAK